MRTAIDDCSRIAKAGAHRRLAQANYFRRAGHAALREHGLKRDQQLEVEIENIYFSEYH